MGSGGGSTTINSEDKEYNARMATIAEAQQNMAEEYYDYYQSTYRPYETEQIAANRALVPLQSGAAQTAYGAIGNAMDADQMADTAQGEAELQFAGAQSSINRNLASRGVSMNSGQAASMQKELALEKTKAIGGARTQARMAAGKNAMGYIGGMQQ